MPARAERVGGEAVTRHLFTSVDNAENSIRWSDGSYRGCRRYPRRLGRRHESGSSIRNSEGDEPLRYIRLRRAAGALGTRHSPRPRSIGGTKDDAQLGAMARASAELFP